VVTEGPDQILQALRRVFRSGISDRGVLVDVVMREDRPLVTFRWAQDPHVFGILLDAPDPMADSLTEWAHEVGIEVMEDVVTGRVYRSIRSADEGFLLLSERNRPVDERVHSSEMNEESDGWWLLEHGFDTTVALTRKASGELISWLMAYVNNSRGEPVIGQAVVAWSGDGAAHIEVLETASGTPVTAQLDLVHLACVMAAEAGAHRVTTTSSIDELELLGFKTAGDDQRVVDTAFLDVDLPALAVLYREARGRLPLQVLRGPSSWSTWVKRRLFTRTYAG
jgi:hypothetical protein